MVALVRTQHKATADSIHTFYCRFSGSFSNRHGVNQLPAGEYWRTPFASRVRCVEGSKPRIDYLVKGGKGMSLYDSATPEGRPHRAGAIVKDDGTADPRMDVWYHAGLAFTSLKPPHAGVSLDEYLSAQGTEVVQAERVNENGKNLIRLVIHAAKTADITMWFDPEANYLLDRALYVSREGNPPAIPVQMQVKSRTQTGGIAFPTKVEVRHGKEDPPAAIETFHFSDVKVNSPLPSGIFDMTFGPGTIVDDLIAGERYVVGSDGKSTMREPLPGPPPPTAGTPEKSNHRQPTTHEPGSWTFWLIPLSLAALGAALVLRVVRSRGLK